MSSRFDPRYAYGGPAPFLCNWRAEAEGRTVFLIGGSEVPALHWCAFMECGILEHMEVTGRDYSHLVERIRQLRARYTREMIQRVIQERDQWPS